jgi:hypothetical protein
MKPFIFEFGRMSQGHTSPHASIPWTDEGRIHLALWCAYLGMLAAEPAEYARDVMSFEPQAPDMAIQTDGSLEGIGIIVNGGFTDRPDQCLPGHIAIGVDLRELFPTDRGSDYQNTMEFIALVAGIAWILSGRKSPFSIKAYGDSSSALNWAESMRVRSNRATPAAIVLVLLEMRFGHVRIESEHVPGEDNDACDYLSRPSRWIETPPKEMNNIAVPQWLAAVIRACDPGRQPHDVAEFLAMWSEAKAAVDGIPHPN